jgi:coenzyme F420 hydrogenase subunit beta
MASFKVLESKVVNRNYCCGCGICAGVCPEAALSIEFNAYGEYRPHANIGTCTGCGLCVKVCPGNPENPDQDALASVTFSHLKESRYLPETGIVDRCFVGNAPDQGTRLGGASGGIVTWMLCELLASEVVDHVIAVQQGGKDGVYFKFQVMNNVEAIRQSSKSAYYPVEMSDAIRYLLSHEGRYAIVALPCAAKGLRLLRAASKIARARIVLILGLVCGKNKSKYYTEALLSHFPITGPVSQVCYRDKEGTKSANDYYFSAKDSTGKIHRLRWSQGVNRLFCQNWFDLKSCRLCDDIFAECADAAFMDAWLPEFSSDIRGTNFVLSRNVMLSSYLEKCCQPISLEKVIQSQQGVIKRKRLFLEYKCKKAKRPGRLHLSLVRGWRQYQPHNWLHWRYLRGSLNQADMIDGLIDENEKWFSGFLQIYNKWQKTVRTIAFVEKLLRVPIRGARLILKILKRF